MSIRALALELYRAQKNMAAIQKDLESAGADAIERLRQDLRAAEKEMLMLRKMLDGKKESGAVRLRFSGFSSWKA